MLVLSRKEQEVICIGDDIRITIVAIRNGYHGLKTWVGVDAPSDVRVDRLEVHLARARDGNSCEAGSVSEVLRLKTLLTFDDDAFYVLDGSCDPAKIATIIEQRKQLKLSLGVSNA